MNLIIDGNNLAYRIYYKFPNLTAFGKNTSIIYGTIREILKLKNQYKPKTITVCYDSKKSLRKRYCKTYKKTRKKEPGFLTVYEQINILHKHILFELSINTFKKDNYEADDLIAFLCQQLEQQKEKIIVISSDNDFYQLLSKYTQIYNWKSIYNQESFMKQYAFKSSYYPIYKALVGDRSDNIQGIRGIGPKKAKELMQQSNYDVHNIGKIIEKQEEFFEALGLILLPFYKLKKPKLRPLQNFRPDIEKVSKVFSRYNIRSISEREFCS